jgi:curved DNA-binding protein CbpA
MSTASGNGGDDRVPRLAADCDPTRLQITPAEGYLLSRIDGCTPWSLLREIGGLPAPEVDRRLEAWLRQGVLEIVGETKDEIPSAAGTAPLPEARIDATLEIAVEIQREILAFEKKLSLPYHELLGVPANAGIPAIKKAYFALSRKFHPDRYFRRNLGPFLPRVDLIFKKVLEAYELLSDPTTRAELEKSLRSAGPEPVVGEAAKPVRKASRIAASMSLLAQHKRQLDERKRKAKNFFESGMSAFRASRWLEAAAGVRLAIAYDPRNEAFRESFADVQRRAHDEQAKLFIRKADEAWDMHEFEAAGKYYEDALNFRPYDAELCVKVARIAHQVGEDLRKAKELASTACELEPDNSFYRLVLGKIFKAAGLKSNARREFEAALRLDPMDAEAKRELKSLR